MNLSRFYLGLHLKPIICRILWDFSCRIDVRHDIIPDSCVGTGNSCYEGIGKQGALLFGVSDASRRKRLGAKCCSIGLARVGDSLDVCPSLSWWAQKKRGTMVSKEEASAEEQREHLTPMQERLLGYIAFRTIGRDGTSESKRQLAEHLRSSTKTVDRAITRLSNEGYIEVEENLLPDGRQGANTYRLRR